MLTESCVACGADAPLSDAVHMLVNPKDGSEVTDGYLCRSCYVEHVEPLLPDEEAEGVDDGDDGKPDERSGRNDGEAGDADGGQADGGEAGDADDGEHKPPREA